MDNSIKTETKTSVPNEVDYLQTPNGNVNSKADGDTDTEAEITTLLKNDSVDDIPLNVAEVDTLKGSVNLSEMESSLESNNFPSDEVPEPIKVLDDIISEFEETSKPIIAASVENQSEDDGYMSLSRKNMRKNDSEEASLSSLNRTSVEVPIQYSDTKTNGDLCSSTENLKLDLENLTAKQNLIQSTLPKARSATTNTVQANYSSLPCCGVRSSSEIGNKHIRIGSCNGDRNILGIDISAVHKAVLRGGVAKLPEPILNEHPVTIYPGRYSPPHGESVRGAVGSNRPRLLTSVEKHKEICHILKPLSSKSSSSSSSPHSTSGSLTSKSQDLHETNSKKGYSENNKNFGKDFRHNFNESEDDDGEEFSEDSVDGEHTLLSTSAELTEKPYVTQKQASIAWEIHFNNERKYLKPQIPSKISTRKQQRKNLPSTRKIPEKQFGIAFSNAIYSLEPEEEYSNHVYAVDDFRNHKDDSDFYPQESNMLGKGTFVIRRNANSKKPPRAIDVFQIPSTNRSSKTFNVAPETRESRQDTTTLPTFMIEENFNNRDGTKFRRKSSQSERDCSQNKRNSLPSSRDRLSLNIDIHNSLRKDIDIKSKTMPSSATVKTPSEEFTKLHRQGVKQMDRQHSIELIKENDIIISDYELTNPYIAYKCSNGSNNMKSVDFSSGKVLDLHPTSSTTTPHTDLAPTIEEDEEQYSDLSYSGATAAPSSVPRLKQIESNISALLRGEIEVARAGDVAPPMRSLEFRPGVHKSESAKEMLLSQCAGFGPLPPSPPPTTSTSKQSLFDYDALPLPPLPPLPPSPTAVSSEGDDENDDDDIEIPKTSYLLRTTSVEVHKPNNAGDEEKKCSSRDHSVERRDREREKRRVAIRQMSDELPMPPTITSLENMPPAVPPHRGHSTNTMKSWSIDSNYRRRSPKVIGGSIGCYGGGGGSGITTPTGTQMGLIPNDALGIAGAGGSYSTKRYISYGTRRTCKQSPRDEHRGTLQTSCSLPETPIFARGCDVPRTPYRRNNENPVASGSRTAPRSSTSHSINIGNSIVGIGGGGTCGGITSMCRQRSISHALASNEMLRMSGVPARGWYPKQRTMRPASIENIDRLTSMRVWDCATSNIGTNGTSSRKPLTLPPNLTPSFLNKSPREALRRVTSLLITKKKNTKDRKTRPYYEDTVDTTMSYEMDSCSLNKDTKRDSNCNNSALPKVPKPPKKKGLFKNLWKRTKHFSLDQ